MTVALLLGLVHAATDLVTITTLFRATGLDAVGSGTVFAWVLAYDALAFAGQPLIGLAADRMRPGRVLLGGLAVVGAGLGAAGLAGAHSGLGLTAVLLAALGNAVAHLGAGAVVLRADLTRAAPAGLLVAPGAVGLGLGLWFGRSSSIGPLWWVAVPLVAAAALVVRLDRAGALDPAHRWWRPSGWTGERLHTVPAGTAAAAAALLLLTSVAIRSLVGSSAARGYPPGPWLAVGIPAVAFAGKALGGLLADRVGWLRTTVGALLVSAPLIAVRHDGPALLLVGLLVFQLTMPVTLVAIGRLLPARPATAFGLPCAALLVGSLPASFAWGAQLCSRPMLGAWAVLSAAAAWGGLTALGSRWRRTPPTRTALEPTAVPVAP